MTKKFSAFVILLMAFTFSMAASGARIQQDEPASAPESYIRDVKLIGGNSSEVSSLKAKARKEGWTVIESDLNAGTRGDIIYLCYKTGTGGNCITDLYLSSSHNPVGGSITVKGREYTLCPKDGGIHFTHINGDLNSNAGGDDIHLYYTKDRFGDGRALTDIWFNASAKGAVGKNGTDEAYDLNKGAGGDDIFLHFSTTKSSSSSSSSSSTTVSNSPKPSSGGEKYVSAVKLIGGNSSEVSSLKAKARKEGWTVIESDLNAGTRGDIIYLCYKTGTGGNCITDLYLSSRSNPVSGSLTVGGRSYTLCPYEGGSHFTGIKGDLNSNAGGDDIHIYYTQDSFGDGRRVTGIWFNASSGGAVGKDGGSAYDLNKGAGGDDIFMHFSTR